MQPYTKSDIDEVDIRIIEELAIDGRIPIRQLADKLGITRRTAHSRLQRIISSGIIKVMAFPIWPLTGLQIQASVGINVKPGYSVYTVAESLTEYPNFYQVALATGPYDILTWAFFKDLDSLSIFLRYELGKIPGISSIETDINMETLKYFGICSISDEVHMTQDILLRTRGKITNEYYPDSVDKAIIKELQTDGRMAILELAKRIGISRISVSKRLQHLISEGIIVVIALTAPNWHEVTARIGIRVLPGTSDHIAQELASFPAVHYMAMTLGQYDIMLGVHFLSLDEMALFLIDKLRNMPGIVKTETMVYLEYIKSPFGSTHQ